MTSAWPLSHPSRLMTSWIAPLKSGVRWFGPTSPAFHATGTHVVAARVRGRDEMSPRAELNAGALSAASAWGLSDVATFCASLALNWIQAAGMVAPGGIARLVHRLPTGR